MLSLNYEVFKRLGVLIILGLPFILIAKSFDLNISTQGSLLFEIDMSFPVAEPFIDNTKFCLSTARISHRFRDLK